VEHEEEQLFPAAKQALTSEQAEQMDRRYEATEEQEKMRL
jgi:hypothetical protein